MAPCSIRWCDKTSQTSSLEKDGITFHLFPRHPKMKEKWINVTRRNNWFPSKHSVICSRHFTKDCFVMTKSRRRLLGSAIPTLHLPLLSAGEKSDDSSSESSTESSISTESTQSKKRKEFPGSPSDYDSPTEKRLCRRIIDLTEAVSLKNRELKNLREKLRYTRKRVAFLENALSGVDKEKIVKVENLDEPESSSTKDDSAYMKISPRSSPLTILLKSDPLDTSPHGASRSPKSST
uniref:THAP-type domain-containing protein n=1 Tax=Pectinophora gossypiella TaxID=13191 RepID=A0A1E1VXX4_PECGO